MIKREVVAVKCTAAGEYQYYLLRVSGRMEQLRHAEVDDHQQQFNARSHIFRGQYLQYANGQPGTRFTLEQEETIVSKHNILRRAIRLEQTCMRGSWELPSSEHVAIMRAVLGVSADLTRPGHGGVGMGYRGWDF